MARDNAIIVDADGKIKHVVTKFSMLGEFIEAHYICDQSIDGGSFVTSTVSVRNEGDDRCFIVKDGNHTRLQQVKTPRTYEDLEKTKEILREFNGIKPIQHMVRRR